jgi:small subunit ribosomal protein S14
MAKLSIIARDKKKEKLVARYAAKRKSLKAAGDWEGLDAADANLLGAHVAI